MHRWILIIALLTQPVLPVAVGVCAEPATETLCAPDCCPPAACCCEVAPAEPAPAPEPIAPDRTEARNTVLAAAQAIAFELPDDADADRFQRPVSTVAPLAWADDVQAVLCVWRT